MKHLKTLLISLAILGLSMSSAFAQTYHTGDIAVVNAIIDNNGLAWTKAPTNGSSVPYNWTGVDWSMDATNKRIVKLDIYDKGLHGDLDVSQLNNLEYLDCDYNNLTALNVSELNKLEFLDCGDNKLTTLDVSGLNNLIWFSCGFNNLTTLDVSGLNNLEGLDCRGNNLTALNVSGLSKLTELDCNSNNLTTLNLTGLSNLTELDCNSNNLTTLNLTGLSSLETLSCGFNNLTTLDVSGLNNLEGLNCGFNNLTALNVSGLSKLNYLDCYSNNLTTLDVSGLSNLTTLYCDINNLTTLDVSNLNNLVYLSCVANNLTKLYLPAGSVKLKKIYCLYNSLTDLNVTGLTLSALDCRYNFFSDKSKIVGFPTTGWDNIDFFFNPQKVAPGTYNPGDLAVINAIIENNHLHWEYLPITDGSCVPADWTGVTWSADATNKRIVKLGIYDKGLHGDLDVSQLNNLERLDCSHNNLNTLNVSGLNNLTWLNCYHNNLTKLNVSGLNNLTELYCEYNNLTSLNVTGLPLTWLHCYQNYMPNESAVIGFTGIWNDSNFKFNPQKTPADIIPVTDIINLVTHAGVSIPTLLNGTIIPATATFQAIEWLVIDGGGTGAVISGVNGDIFTASAVGVAKMKAFILHGITIGQPYEQEFLITVSGVGIEQLRITNDELRVYPNPTTGELRVTSDELQVTSIEIFDMMGRRHECTKARMHEGTKGLVMDISNLPAGIYLLRIQTEKGMVMKKVIKN